MVQTLEASSDGADAAEPASASAEDPSPNPVGEPLPDAGASGDPADSSDGGAPQDASNSDTSTQTPGDEDTSSAADSSQDKPDNDAASGGEAQDDSTEPVAASEGEVPADEGPAEDPLTAGTYARVATACTVRVGAATDSTALATVAGGVVYVAEVDSEAAQAKVCFASGTLACTGWTDASALTALTAEETAALSFPEDAPRVDDDPLPDPNAEFLLRLTIDACPVLAPGATCTLRASYSDGADYGVSWSSSDPSIAEVAADGSLTAVAPGSATITAQGICAPASISVTVAVPEPEFLSLNVASIVIGQGETLENALACTVLPEGCDANLTWTSSSTRYVKVDKDTGALYGVRAGSATVAVSTDNGLRAVCKVTVRSAPKSVKLTVSKTVLGVNDAASFAVSFPSNTYSHHIDYSIDNESVLRIENGQLCAVGPGTAKLTVRTFNGKTASVAVTVVPAPESVHFASETPVLGVGQEFLLSASVNEGSASAITFTGDNDSVATVTPDGKLVARGEGSCTVTATAYNGISAQQTVTVVPAPTSIALSATSVTLCVGEKVDEPVTVTPDNGMTGGLSFKSSSARYATVSSTGRVSALRAGSVTITVTAYNGVSAKYTVKIVKAPSKLTLTGAKLLGVDDSAVLKVTANAGAGVGQYSLTSSAPEVLRVEPDGRTITAVSVGTAVVTARNFNNRTASLSVTVVPAPESVHFASETPVLGVGQEFLLAASVNEGSASAITFTVDNDSVATVTPDGKLVARGEGSCTVTATAYNGISAQQTVTVVPAPTSMEFAETPVYLGLNETLTDALRIVLNEGSAAGISFKSSSTRYVKVDASTGKLTGVRVGNAVITATSHNGLTATCRVIVQKAPTKVTLKAPMPAFSVGQTQQVSVTVTGRGHYTLTSSNPDVIAVEEGDVLQALSEGVATITARTYNGKTASINITVAPAPQEIHPCTEMLSVGECLSVQAEFAVNAGSYTDFTYAVEDPEVASVDASGLVTGLRSGSTRIFATTHNGLSASVELTVLPAPESIQFESNPLTIGLGELRPLHFIAAPENAVGVYTYASDNTKIVSVSEDGTLAGIATGTATVTVTAQNGTSAALEVTVVPYSSVNSAYCMAHRGASGYYPGNSLAAFRYAAVLGADMVELDVRKSLDGTIVVVHDSTISYNGKKYSVANLTLQQIRIATPDICTLDEALALIASTDMEVMIEFKIAGIEQDVLDCVDANGLQNRAKYGSFTLSVINKVKALRPSAETIYIMNTTDTLNKVVSNPSAYSASTISVSSSILTPTAIYRLHLGGKQVVAWTINSRSEIARFVAMGVDGITTDYPDYM
ncbi:MAG: Ig-like domain-containing protein [Eubacteriales bacterium]|nr:Ig-like domain-containing protein [Eubacteriales bacterium]